MPTWGADLSRLEEVLASSERAAGDGTDLGAGI
jgi:hypothetical protein